MLHLDVSEVLDLTELAREAMAGTVPRAFAQTVAEAVRTERVTHAYTNRTGNAQRSTRATIVNRDANNVDIDAVAGAEYASFLARHGWSDFEALMGDASVQIINGFETIGKQLER